MVYNTTVNGGSLFRKLHFFLSFFRPGCWGVQISRPQPFLHAWKKHLPPHPFSFVSNDTGRGGGYLFHVYRNGDALTGSVLQFPVVSRSRAVSNCITSARTQVCYRTTWWILHKDVTVLKASLKMTSDKTVNIFLQKSCQLYSFCLRGWVGF